LIPGDKTTLQGLKQAAEKGHDSGEKLENHTAGAEAHIDLIGFMPGINPRPTTRTSFSAACKAHGFFYGFSARLKSCPDSYCETELAPWHNALEEIAGYLLGCGVDPRLEGVAVEDGIGFERAGDGDGEDLVAHSPNNTLAHASLAIVRGTHERFIADGLDGRGIGSADLGHRRHALMGFGRNFNGDAKGAGDPCALLRKGANGRLAGGCIGLHPYSVSAQQAPGCGFVEPGAVVFRMTCGGQG
jgi:hypothetical protein